MAWQKHPSLGFSIASEDAISPLSGSASKELNMSGSGVAYRDDISNNNYSVFAGVEWLLSNPTISSDVGLIGRLNTSTYDFYYGFVYTLSVATKIASRIVKYTNSSGTFSILSFSEASIEDNDLGVIKSIEFRVNGSHLSLAINGSPICGTNNSTISSGKPGLGSNMVLGNGNVIERSPRLINFVVRSIP
jgi:hypothetical protein